MQRLIIGRPWHRLPLCASIRAAPVGRYNDIRVAETFIVEAVADRAVPASFVDLIALIERMRAGDERALAELYDATVGKLYALAGAILRNNEDAEEIVCATYAYAWSNAARFDRARANPLGWLLMLCRSRALDCLRQRRALGVKIDVAALDEVATDTRPDELLSLFEARTRVHAALNRLSPERRRMVSLAFLRGLSHQEIAQMTGLALGTVKSHVRRALEQLRADLETP